MPWTYVASQSIASTDTSSAIYTLTVPSSLGAIQRAECLAWGSLSVWYWTLDGSAPSSANGKRIQTSAQPTRANNTLVFQGNELQRLQLSGATSGLHLEVDYFT